MDVKHTAQSLARITELIRDAHLAEHVGRWARTRAAAAACTSHPCIHPCAECVGGLFVTGRLGEDCRQCRDRLTSVDDGPHLVCPVQPLGQV